MISENHKILVHRAIDGELSDAEKKDFNSLLESSQEVRQFHTELLSLAALPTQLPSVDAPSELKEQIQSRVNELRHQRTPRPSNPRTIGALFGTLLTPRLAFGLAAGLVIGVGLSALTFGDRSSQLNRLDLSGTLIAGKDSKDLSRVDEDSFSEDQVVGQIAVEAGSGLAYVQLELQSTTEVMVVLDYDPMAYSLRAIERKVASIEAISSSPGHLTVSHAGENHYLFVFSVLAQSSNPVVLHVEAQGTVYTRELRL